MNSKCNKTAMVTGATGGIGRATIISLIDEGYDVIVHYRNNEVKACELYEIAKGKGRKAMKVKADLSNINDIKDMFDAVFNEFDHIDLLVNNAGMALEIEFLDVSEEDFAAMNEADWRSVFFCSQYVARRMVEKNISGVIINVTSNQVEGCWPRSSVYAPVKAAVTTFTKNVSMELAQHGIRVVAIAPGYTDVGWPEDSHLRDAEKLLPFKRFATTTEIAQGIMYLASDQASYITGSVLTIDGGATLPVVACHDF